MAADSPRKRTKSGASKTQASSPIERDLDSAAGYVSDAGSVSRSRTKLKKKSKPRKKSDTQGEGYETDDGYLTSQSSVRKTKTRKFFKLGNRSKSQVDDDESVQEVIPPLPTPVFRLPIAARFATTLGDVNWGATVEAPVILPSPAPPKPTISSLADTLSPFSTQRAGDLDSVEIVSTPLDHTFKRNLVRFQTEQQEKDRDRDRDRDSGNGSSERGHASSPSPPFTSPQLTARPIFPSFDSVSSTTTTKSRIPIIGFPSRSQSPPTKPPPVISYPNTRSPSPPDVIQSIPTLNPPVQPNTNKAKPVPRPLFIRRTPSDQGKSLQVQGSHEEYSPAGSPFVVLTPNPPLQTEREKRSGGIPQAPKLLIPTWNQNRLSPEPSTDYIVPSPNHHSDFIIPSPHPELGGNSPSHLVPPTQHYHYDLPPATPPPTSPLPDVPAINVNDADDDDEGGFFASQQQKSRNLGVSSPTPPAQRGRESPFPARPVLASTPVTSGGATKPKFSGFESRVKVKRYRDLYGWKGGDDEDGDFSSSRATSPNNLNYSRNTSTNPSPVPEYRPSNSMKRRPSTKVGINVQLASDDEGYGGDDAFEESDVDEEMRYVVDGVFGTSTTATFDDGRYYREAEEGEQQEEAALSRSHSYEALKDRFNSGLTGFARPRRPGRGQADVPASLTSSSIDFDSTRYFDDDRSRYPDDEVASAGRTTMYMFDNDGATGDSRRNSWDSDSNTNRASFLDGERSHAAREKFLRRVDMMFDENGREKEKPKARFGVNKVQGQVPPPVPRLPVPMGRGRGVGVVKPAGGGWI